MIMEIFGSGTDIVINMLAFGDSLTRGYYNNGRGHHPYTMKLQYLLNNFDPKRYVWWGKLESSSPIFQWEMG